MPEVQSADDARRLAIARELGWRDPRVERIIQQAGDPKRTRLRESDPASLVGLLGEFVAICRDHQSPGTRDVVARSIALLSRILDSPLETEP